MEQFKQLFDELFVKKMDESLQAKISTKTEKKKRTNEDLMNSSRWLSVTYFDSYFKEELWKNYEVDACDIVFDFYKFLHEKLHSLSTNKYLLKIVFHSKTGYKLCFLFNKIHSLNFLKTVFPAAIKIIQEYLNMEAQLLASIKNTFKQNTKEIFFEQKGKGWFQVNLLFHAGKYHHDNIAMNLTDKRISKPDLLINRERLDQSIKYKNFWELKADNVKSIRVKPNDIALYSKIAMANLGKAKEIHNEVGFSSSKVLQTLQKPDDERKFIDYCELIIISIIMAYSSVEALINIAIPKDYKHSRKQKNRDTGRLKKMKNSKIDIERWYNLDDKMNVVLPDALGIPFPYQQKWWVRFDQLKKLRDKFIHVVESKSKERYSELLENRIFVIVESHVEIIKFFGKWATDNHHCLLNELPYGFGYDDIMPFVIGNDNYTQVMRERKGLDI